MRVYKTELVTIMLTTAQFHLDLSAYNVWQLSVVARNAKMNIINVLKKNKKQKCTFPRLTIKIPTMLVQYTKSKSKIIGQPT